MNAKHAPAYVTGYALGSGPEVYAMTNYYGSDLGASPNAYVAPELWKNTGLKPADIPTATLSSGTSSSGLTPRSDRRDGQLGEDPPAPVVEGADFGEDRESGRTK